MLPAAFFGTYLALLLMMVGVALAVLGTIIAVAGVAVLVSFANS